MDQKTDNTGSRQEKPAATRSTVASVSNDMEYFLSDQDTPPPTAQIRKAKGVRVVNLSLSLCLFVCLFVCLSPFLSLFLSFCLSVFLCVSECFARSLS